VRLSVTATTADLLDGRAFDRAVGTENATVAPLGVQDSFAVPALVKPLAGVRGHGLRRHMAALGAGDGGLQYDLRHRRMMPQSTPPGGSIDKR